MARAFSWYAHFYDGCVGKILLHLLYFLVDIGVVVVVVVMLMLMVAMVAVCAMPGFLKLYSAHIIINLTHPCASFCFIFIQSIFFSF